MISSKTLSRYLEDLLTNTKDDKFPYFLAKHTFVSESQLWNKIKLHDNYKPGFDPNITDLLYKI